MLEIYDLLVGIPIEGDWVLHEPGVHATGSDPDEWWDGMIGSPPSSQARACLVWCQDLLRRPPGLR
jgi:hypothetical protein